MDVADSIWRWWGFGHGRTRRAAVVSGAADAVVVYRAFNERSGRRFGQPMAGPPPPSRIGTVPTDSTRRRIYSLWFQRYMHRYGVANEDFGRYSVVARKHAATNPNAWYYKRPISLEDHQNSRWIVEPILRLLDCCQESDGGVALVVTRTDRARDLRQPPVAINAATQGNVMDGEVLFNYYGGDISRLLRLSTRPHNLGHDWLTAGRHRCGDDLRKFQSRCLLPA